jgi:1,2-diacylglycerol 3-beta-glucosyltransferase
VLELAILVSLAYALALFAVSRRRRPTSLPAPDGLQFVFVIPCLDEEFVIGQTLEALLATLGQRVRVLVVDDGSDDRTSEIVRGQDPTRVWLLERRPPEARHGKGEALNAAYRYLRQSDILAGKRPEEVVIAVFDADGRIGPSALLEVASYFRDPRTGAVQVGVEMRNERANLLTRLQDFEFVVFSEIFQRARERLGSVALGGNGQFVRLSALDTLGPSPWSNCLTEDLDLGLRLLLGGWKNRYCPTEQVSQQAVFTARRWWRQRSRWFQGHLQCWRFLPRILRSDLQLKARVDLLWYLTAPSAILATPMIALMVVVGLAALLVSSPEAGAETLAGNTGMLAVLYLLAFGSAFVFGGLYWLRGRSTLASGIVLGHVFALYTYLWAVAGWVAVWRIVAGRHSWAKTDRTREPSRAVKPSELSS